MDESNTRRREWEVAVRTRGLIPQPHGGALMPGGGFRLGAGRPKSLVKLALEKARGDLRRQLELAVQFRDDQSLPAAERLRAINFILKLSRLGREKSRRSKGSPFRVARRMHEEATAILAGKKRSQRF